MSGRWRRVRTASAPAAAGVLALIEGESFELQILVARGGRMVLRSDRPAAPLPREEAGAMIQALAVARLSSSLGSVVKGPIDVERRVEAVELPPLPVEPAMHLLEDESYGVFTTAKGPDAVIGLVLRDTDTQLDSGTLGSMIARLTSAWLWLWNEASID